MIAMGRATSRSTQTNTNVAIRATEKDGTSETTGTNHCDDGGGVIRSCRHLRPTRGNNHRNTDCDILHLDGCVSFLSLVHMTTIVGVQGDKFAVVGTDSRVSSLDDNGFPLQTTTLASGTSKVAQNGKYLLGASGDVRGINLLHHVFVPPSPPNTKGKKLDQFVTRAFIPALRQCFEEHGFSQSSSSNTNQQAEYPSTVLMVVHGVIYVIEGDYSWVPDTSGMYAIGTGSCYALGALHAMPTTKNLTPQTAKRNIVKALQIASRFDPFTGSPFQTFIQEHNGDKTK